MRARVVVAKHDRAVGELRANDEKVGDKARILSAVNRTEIRRTPMVVPVHMKDAQRLRVGAHHQSPKSRSRNGRTYRRVIDVFAISNRLVVHCGQLPCAANT